MFQDVQVVAGTSVDCTLKRVESTIRDLTELSHSPFVIDAPYRSSMEMDFFPQQLDNLCY
jgi:hypothetical protein